MKKPLLALLALAVLSAASLWYLEWRSASSVQPQAAGQVPELAPQQTSSSQQPAGPVSWEIQEVFSGDGEAAPRSRVSVVAGGEARDLGEHEGSCSTIAGSAWSLAEGEVSGVICWWAGGGTELGVFSEGGRLVVKRGVLEEGSEEYGGFRGDFQAVLAL